MGIAKVGLHAGSPADRKRRSKNTCCSPGWAARLVRASSQYSNIVGLIPSEDTYKNQPMDASISEALNHCFSQINK